MLYKHFISNHAQVLAPCLIILMDRGFNRLSRISNFNKPWCFKALGVTS